MWFVCDCQALASEQFASPDAANPRRDARDTRASKVNIEASCIKFPFRRMAYVLRRHLALY